MTHMSLVRSLKISHLLYSTLTSKSNHNRIVLTAPHNTCNVSVASWPSCIGPESESNHFSKQLPIQSVPGRSSVSHFFLAMEA